MRPAIALSPLDERPWEPLGPAGLLVRELSRDPAAGSRTAMLRSAPRPAIEHKAQYHLGEEEFYCLGGEFTFDGVDWFRPGSYVHFPAKTVHGARVHVPGGYLLYLRTTGDATAHRVEAPLRETPYPLDEPTRVSRAFTHRDARDAATRQVLRRDPASGARVELIPVQAGEPLVIAPDGSSGRVELLLVRGTLAGDDGTVIGAPAYGHYPAGLGGLRLRAKEPALVLAHVGDWP